MPYIFEEFPVTISNSGYYRLTQDWGLPITSPNPEAYLYSTPQIRYEIFSFPPTFIGRSNEAKPQYPNFASCVLFSGINDRYFDEFTINYKEGFYAQGNRINTIQLSTSGQISITGIQVKLNYNPCIIKLYFRGNILFID